MKLIFQVVTLVSVACAVFGQEDSCTTPTGSDGRCILISNCEKLKRLIKGSVKDREFINRYHCGFKGVVPMVCCPTVTNATTHISPERGCITLDNTIGTCVNLETCPNIVHKLIDRTRENLEYVHRSRCVGSAPNSVCCDKASYANRDKNLRFSRILPFDKGRDGEILCLPSPGLPEPNGNCCGVDSGSENKIFNGLPASIDQYPWLAMIEYIDGKKDNLCGGSLISSQYVLTAAHCLVTLTNEPIGAKSVRLGEYNITNNGPDCSEVDGGGIDCTFGATSIPIAATIVHPFFNQHKHVQVSNDIALIKLSQMAPYNAFIKPICLPTLDISKSPPSDLRFFVAGWGAFDKSHKISDIKLHTDLPYIDERRCRKMWKLKGKKKFRSQICAGAESDKDSCEGDSGGPLMHYNTRKYEIIGVDSFGTAACAVKGIPSVYTKVYDYIPWIKRVVKSNGIF